MASPKSDNAKQKSDNMKTQPSTPTSKLSVGLKNINNTNKPSTVMAYLKLYFSRTSSGIFFFHGSTALSGPTPHF